jgi:hypothetical protein
MTASAIRPAIHPVVLVAMLAICAGAAVWPASAQERKAVNGSPASQVSRDAVGTWFWTQGVAIPNPAGGDPIVLPFEVLGVPSIMRLSPDGGVTDLCGVVHPTSRGATYELPFGVLTIPVSASDGLGNWMATRNGIVVNWRKLIFNEQGNVIGSMIVILETTRLTDTQFEGFSKVLFLDLNSAPMPLVFSTAMPPTAVMGGPTKGVKMPMVRLADVPF